MNVGDIEYTVSVETKKSIDAAKKLDDSLAKSEKSLKKAGRGAKSLNASLTPIASSIRNAFSPGNTRGIESTTQQLNNLHSTALRLASALGVAFSARAFGSMIKRNIDLANSTLDVATKLGTTTEELSKLRYAVSQTSGMASGDFDIALQRMTRRLAEAAQGGGVAKDAIEELGLSAKALSDMRPDEAFRLIMEQMSKLPDQADRVRLAFKFFDSGGVALASTARTGAAEINRLGDRLEELGGVIDTSAAKQAAELNAKLSDLQERAKGTGMSIANDAMPAIEDFVDLISDPQVAQSLGNIASAIVKVGGAAVNAASGLAEFTRWAAESVAAFRHGAALDDVVRLQDELKTYQDMLNNPLKRLRVGAAGQGVGKLFSKEEIEKEIALREKQIQAFYDSQSAAAGSAASLKEETAAIHDNGIALGKSTEGRKEATGAVRQQRDAAGELIKSLSLMNAMLGMSQTEAALYRLKVEGATDAQIAQAAVLLESIDAFKQTEQAQQAYQHTMKSLSQELKLLALQGRELAQEQSVLQLGEYATDEQIRAVRELSGALYDARMEAEQAEQVRRAAAAIDPMEAERQRFEERMEQIRLLEESEAISAVRLAELKLQTQEDYHARIAELQEEAFRRQSLGNELIMSSLDRMGDAAAGAFTGLLTGATNSREAVQQLAQAILQDAVGALVQMGVEQAKQMVMGQTAQAASAATAATTGAAITAAYTPAAAAASVASFGGAASAGLSSMAAAVPAMMSMFAVGSRRQGGPVSPGSMYRVNEGGRPEVFQNNLGQQYMIPNERGKVISNRDAQSGASGGVVVNLYEDASKSGRTEQRQIDEQTVIDIFVSNIMQDGPAASAMEQKYGMATVGR